VATPISGAGQIYFLRGVKGKLCSKFGEEWSKTELTILAVVARWTDTGWTRGRTEGRTDTVRQSEFILYPMLFIALLLSPLSPFH